MILTNSDHKKEVHASVAASLSKLQTRYQSQLPDGDIFALVQGALESVCPKNYSFRFIASTVEAKLLQGSIAINKLLSINPHTRAGTGGEDTLLNAYVLQLCEGKPDHVQKAIRTVAYYRSHRDDLRYARHLLGTLKRYSNFKDGSQVGYEELLRLIYAAITDESWGGLALARQLEIILWSSPHPIPSRVELG